MGSLRYLGNNCITCLNIDGFRNTVVLRNYAFKSDLKIKWVRPEKIPFYKPAKSGDLESYPEIDKKQTILEFKNSKELQTADENVKKLFSLEFAPKKHTNRVFYNEVVEKVKRHEFDHATIETKIAKWTGVIRAQQQYLERFPRNIILKVILKELIERRKKHLKHLRRWDYKKFEWLLEALNLEYKPEPVQEYYKVTRKESLQKLTNKYCGDIKESRLKKYRLRLESEQPAFLEEKIRTLTFIRNEQIECGVEVTVTEEEIQEVKKQLEDLNKKNELYRENND